MKHRKSRSHRSGHRSGHRGGGVQTSQQFFDPTVFPPSAGFMAANSTAPTVSNIRPMLMSTFQAGGSRRRGSQRGGGVQTSQQFFDPVVFPPSAGVLATMPSTNPTANAIRPVLLSTFPAQSGGTRRDHRRDHRRGAKMSGGFSPSVMGGFVANAQAVAVPLVLYLAYHTLVPKKGSKTRKSSRK